MLVENSFFLKEQEVIDSINDRIDAILVDESFNRLKEDWAKFSAQSLQEINDFKNELKDNKEARRLRREELLHNPHPDN
jgi:tRNA pseudouridine32 synthase/23S rRNA pseudouridine746 synthase